MFPDLSFDVPPPPGAGRLPETPAEWIAHIREQDMPAFGATVAAVGSVTRDDKSSAGRLAQVILRDASLTTKVLKLANSAFYNSNQQAISTISRAIVVLGFDLVADIAIGVSLVDAMLSGGQRERVEAEMARCFHAAVQARSLAQLRHDLRAEEIFIATLLARVGELAFWCFGGEAAASLDQALKVPGRSPEEAQMASLGFRLHQLSVGLAREWRLGGLLTSVLEARGKPGPAEQSVQLGLHLAAAVENGWESRQAATAVAAIAAFTGEPAEVVRPRLVAQAEQAAQVAMQFGATAAARQIPQATPAPAVADELPARDEISQGPNPLLQLNILRELSGLIGAGGSLNEVLNLVLEGIFRGIGLERVLFALLTPNRQQVVGKVGLGAGGDALAQRFIFTLEGGADDAMNQVAVRGQTLLLEDSRTPATVKQNRLRAVVGEGPACLAPIQAQGRVVGLFYADRSGSGQAIDGEAFTAFQHFVQQVSFAFMAAANRKA